MRNGLEIKRDEFVGAGMPAPYKFLIIKVIHYKIKYKKI
jgi:hypothetical protein